MYTNTTNNIISYGHRIAVDDCSNGNSNSSGGVSRANGVDVNHNAAGIIVPAPFFHDLQATARTDAMLVLDRTQAIEDETNTGNCQQCE
jgi:hypothetical protein